MTKALFALSLLFLAKAVALADIDLGAHASFTPYDPYMRPVKEVLSALPGDTVSMDRVQKLMRVGRGFRYSHTDPYTAALPSVTATARAGDCKAKALWLADQLGDEKVRFVIGKATRRSKVSHAWVMWENEGRWWILDCTNTSRPLAADRVSKNEYVPLYSYAKSGSYRHASTRILTAGVAGVAGVAGKINAVAAPVAAR